MRQQTKCLARASIGAAVGVVFLYAAALLPSGRLGLLCLASLGVVFVHLSCSGRWALGAYAVTAALALLLLPQKAVGAVYALFGGLYPVLKLRLEKMPQRVLRWGIKLAYFNLVAALTFWLFSALFSTTLPVWALFALGNILFLVYDFALTQAILLYIRKIAGRIGRI